MDTSVHKDSRGEIRRYKIEDVNFNALFTKAGALRSGDMHPNSQYDLVMKGEIEITLKQNNKDVIIKKAQNELIVIPKDTPHLFKSLTDSVVIEWWSGPFKAEYYRPYRKLVEEQMKKEK